MTNPKPKKARSNAPTPPTADDFTELFKAIEDHKHALIAIRGKLADCQETDKALDNADETLFGHIEEIDNFLATLDGRIDALTPKAPEPPVRGLPASALPPLPDGRVLDARHIHIGHVETGDSGERYYVPRAREPDEVKLKRRVEERRAHIAAEEARITKDLPKGFWRDPHGGVRKGQGGEKAQRWEWDPNWEDTEDDAA